MLLAMTNKRRITGRVCPACAGSGGRRFPCRRSAPVGKPTPTVFPQEY